LRFRNSGLHLVDSASPDDGSPCRSGAMMLVTFLLVGKFFVLVSIRLPNGRLGAAGNRTHSSRNNPIPIPWLLQTKFLISTCGSQFTPHWFHSRMTSVLSPLTPLSLSRLSSDSSVTNRYTPPSNSILQSFFSTLAQSISGFYSTFSRSGSSLAMSPSSEVSVITASTPLITPKMIRSHTEPNLPQFHPHTHTDAHDHHHIHNRNCKPNNEYEHVSTLFDSAAIVEEKEKVLKGPKYVSVYGEDGIDVLSSPFTPDTTLDHVLRGLSHLYHVPPTSAKDELFVWKTKRPFYCECGRASDPRLKYELSHDVRSRLELMQKQAYNLVFDQAQSQHSSDRAELVTRLSNLESEKKSSPDDLLRLADEIQHHFHHHAPLHIHFNPTIISKLRLDGFYRNCYEVDPNHYGCVLDETCQRSEAEDWMFGNHYHLATPVQRPKYGLVNWNEQNEGRIDAGYGACSFVLSSKIRNRVTVIGGDSFDRLTHVATLAHCCNVITAALDDSGLEALVECVRDKDKFTPTNENKTETPAATTGIAAGKSYLTPRSDSYYLEIQIHGMLDLSQDVEYMLVPKALGDPQRKEAELLCQQFGITLKEY